MKLSDQVKNLKKALKLARRANQHNDLCLWHKTCICGLEALEKEINKLVKEIS